MSDSDAHRWLTYDELSAELGITRESARQLSIRKHWGRRKGNDGKARVGVPEEMLRARTSDDTPAAVPPGPSDHTSNGTGHDTSVIPVLTRHIERIENELQNLKAKLGCVEAERDSERQRVTELAVQVAAIEPLRTTIDVLKAAVSAERTQTSELRQERDRWHSLATRPRGFFAWIRGSA